VSGDVLVCGVTDLDIVEDVKMEADDCGGEKLSLGESGSFYIPFWMLMPLRKPSQALCASPPGRESCRASPDSVSIGIATLARGC
jgi:hypothetical protein